MNLSNSGRILIIDDEIAEVYPLFRILSKRNFPFIYFNGNLDDLPDKPYDGIRFVFLDLQITKALAGQPGKTIASAIIAILKKIIATDNGPYIILAWTKRDEIIEDIKTACIQNKIEPLLILNMDKSSLLNFAENSTVNYRIGEIRTKLDAILKQIGAFHFYVAWENMINESMKNFVQTFTTLFTNDQYWSDKTAYLLYKLYKVYVEQNELSAQNRKYQCAIHLLNKSFIDVIENNTVTFSNIINFQFFNEKEIDETFFENVILRNCNQVKQQFLRAYYKSEKKEGKIIYKLQEEQEKKRNKKIYEKVLTYLDSAILTNDIFAKLNTSLFLTINPQISKSPGSLYKLSNKKRLFNVIFNDFLKNEIIPDKIDQFELCALVITPSCDIAQQKIVLHRIVYGLLYKSDEWEKHSLPGYICHIGPIVYKNEIYHILLNFQTIMSISQAGLPDKKRLFVIKDILLFDIQTKVANHVNRLGTYLLK